MRIVIGFAAAFGVLILIAAMTGCAPAQLVAPVTVVEPVCWDMTKRWHFKQGCDVHSAWRYQIEI